MFYVLQRTIHSACSDSFYVAKLQLESIIQNKMQLSCLVFFLFVCFFKTWTVFLLLLNVYLCNLAVPCGILSVLRIFDLLLYLEKEEKKKVDLLLLFFKGKRLDAILDASSASVQMPSSQPQLITAHEKNMFSQDIKMKFQ